MPDGRELAADEALRQAIVGAIYGASSCECCVGSATIIHTADVIPAVWPLIADALESCRLELSSCRSGRDTERAERLGEQELVRGAGRALIAAERLRQVEVEGYTPGHDVEHGGHRLIRAGSAYEMADARLWPFAGRPKFTNPLRNLVKAGALYQAAADVMVDGTYARRDRDRVAASIDGILAEVSRVLPHVPMDSLTASLRSAAPLDPAQDSAVSPSVVDEGLVKP